MNQPDLDGPRVAGGFTLPMLARLAKLPVLFVPPADPPSPSALATLGGVIHAVAWTDQDRARSHLAPGERLVQADAGEFAAALPPGMGLLLDPQAPEPMVVPPESVPLVAEARRDFPEGHAYHLGEREPPATDLFDALRTEIDRDPGALTDARAFWKQVRGQEAEMIVVLEGADDPAERQAHWAPRLLDVVTHVAPPYAVSVQPAATSPTYPLVEHREVVTPFWVAAGGECA